MDSTYYLERKDELLRDLDRAMQRARPAVAPLLGNEHLDEFYDAVRREYAALIPQLPDIGGKRNRLTTNLVQAGWCLAMYRSLKARDISLEQTGEILYQAYAAQMQAYPRWLLSLLGRYMMSPLAQQKLRRAALDSQQRRYTGDWVYDFIPGNSSDQIFGVDYHECGIVKFLKAQGAAELGPYLCKLDYAMCDALHIHLVRTQTIAGRADRCDFRFYRS
jgi:hypothetical protein